ncbi:MAG: hypothetical protein C0483_22170 [Pirellula sp.]|nr:hypothetical protein [Pirellula sp.]
MPLFAQMADMDIDGVVLYVGILALLSPLLGLLLNLAIYRSQFQPRTWKYVFAYYGLGAIALILLPDGPLFFFVLLGMCAVGPILGLVLCLHENNSA